MTADPLSNDVYGCAPLKRPRPARRVLKLAVAIAALAGLAIFAGYGYERLISDDDSVAPQVPLVRAGDAPTKVRPDEPGGMTIPDQDKYVYEALNEEAGDDKVERLLPPPEEPLPPPAAPEPASAEPVAPAPVVAAVPEPTQVTAPAPEPVAPATPEPVAEGAKTVAVAPAKVPEPTVPAAVSYVVQLAAFRSEVNATAAWKQLLNAHRDLLGGLRHKVQRADLGTEKGVYFRLRAGPLVGESAARKLCTRLKARKLDCLVVRP